MTAPSQFPSRVLVICYTRTGNTRTVGQAVAAALDADFEELRPAESGTTPRSYARCALDIIFRRRVTLAPLAHNPAEYDLVVIGTPVWISAASSPVRSFLQVNRSRLPGLAIFLTHGGTARDRVFEQMESLAAQPAIARLAVTERAISSGSQGPLSQRFVEQIRARLPRSAAVPAGA